ncbi:organic cation transporter protein-like isoform X1 [Stegodyphus dumicola]|uniref:organic cation transporter protein-like isoform X1 n=2 Tax=Stegodyphus dumicola TaxID=202533 RepID=UPI0015A91B3A|nr:organic cation transporter protein-like isoform X1 [Stegodyphus dumicola]XP_035233012.1 organic cation transporter protein-like isoform X1 [Stegodyphus dumicola]
MALVKQKGNASQPKDFTNIIGDHWCARSPEAILANVSVEQWINESLPLVKTRTGDMERSRCTMYNDSYANGSITSSLYLKRHPIKCNAWEYDLSFYEATIVDKWNLVCDREWMISITKTTYMVGFLLSSSLSGQISDRIGRRRVVIGCLFVFLAAAFLTLLSESFLMFVILRFFIALGMTSLFTIAIVIFSEVVSAEYRTLYGMTYKYGWAIAYMLLPGIAWLIPDWFWLQLAITLPWLGLLCVFWVVPDTPSWLLAQGKIDKAKEILLRAAKRNKKDINATKAALEVFLSQKTKSEEKQKTTVFDLFKTPALRKCTLIIYFCWFIIGYIYYALSWNTNDLGGNPYITFFISGAVEVPSGLIFLFISRAIGNRKALLIGNLFSGLCLLLISLIPKDMTWLTITFAMAGKFFNAASFDIVFIFTAEIFPTVVRNVGLGSSSSCARIGAMGAPFIRQLGDVTHPLVPLLVPGALSIISGLLLLLLPETKGEKLPDTLEEGEMFSRKQKLQLSSDNEAHEETQHREVTKNTPQNN